MEPLDRPLEIAGCRLLEVAVPLVEPFRISGGTLRARRSLIVELTGASGAVGYGESAPFEEPFYSEETLQSCTACIGAHLFPRLAGRRFDSLEAAIGALERGVRGNRMARAGVETALWDLLSAETGSWRRNPARRRPRWRAARRWAFRPTGASRRSRSGRVKRSGAATGA
jgi:hypothetical protein